MSKNIALVLASGGSRGLAHIGAIDVLEECGFRITSIAGSSMGALVGGMYAARGLDAFKEWMESVDRMKVLSLMDFTLSTKGFVKGDKVMEELQTIVPDVQIEDLDIPFTAVSTDIRHRREVIFDSGSLYEAIRSSISVPSLFTPNRIGDMILIDGGIINPIPLNRVVRHRGDLLVAVDLNAPYKRKEEEEEEESSNPFVVVKRKIDEMMGKKKKEKEKTEIKTQEDMSMVSILDESSSLMLQKNSEKTIMLYPPDVLVRIAKNAYSTLEFYKYDEIVELGRVQTFEALRKKGLV